MVESIGNSLLITPKMKAAMSEQAAQVDKISFWNDGAGDEWRADLPMYIRYRNTIDVEALSMHQMIRIFLSSLVNSKTFKDISPILALMRMIKSH